ncbi:MAG: outer membrane lipoprotein-sorting protein, partial [Desulfobulbaceae bacterium]|nr:outer membrane lipoprotein-sorting protein [Desulfobulbaceae bacterium]
MFLRYKKKLSMKPALLGWACAVASALPLPVFADGANEIIKKVEHNLNGKTAVMNLTMVVKTKRAKRTMKMESYSIGNDKSFIKILYPGKDKGITFLKVDNAMWQYVPRIEKTIKIPASMMLQSWMGSDFTNDDLVKGSSLSNDYTKKLLEETDKEYMVELWPKEEAAVVWGKIIMGVSKQYYLPTTVYYYDEDDLLIRELTYTDVQPFGERFYPTKWLMLPKEPEKADNETI